MAWPANYKGRLITDTYTSKVAAHLRVYVHLGIAFVFLEVACRLLRLITSDCADYGVFLSDDL